MQKQTAQKGDKNNDGCSITRCRSYIQNCLSEDNIKDVLNAGAEALAGAQSTINLKANFGRARNYMENVPSAMDSGAARSCMFASFAEAAKEK